MSWDEFMLSIVKMSMLYSEIGLAWSAEKPSGLAVVWLSTLA